MAPTGVESHALECTHSGDNPARFPFKTQDAFEGRLHPDPSHLHGLGRPSFMVCSFPEDQVSRYHMLAPPGRTEAGRVPPAPAVTKEPDRRGHRAPTAQGQLCQPAKRSSPGQDVFSVVPFGGHDRLGPGHCRMWFSPCFMPMNSL